MGAIGLAGSDKAKVFIARSSAMADLARVAESAAQGSSAIFISGERGAGKRLFAERLHVKSPRRAKPFVRVNCAALQGLAFAAAREEFFGRVELAGEGTLFLDEIAGLPLDLQAELLKALQEKKCGAARIVCSSAADLEKMASAGEFLGELFHRLNVVSLRIPPLRERREDIMPLAEFFLKKFSDETKKNFIGFSSDAKAALTNCYWPGNVRELKNSIERACVFGNPPLATAQNLQLSLDNSNGSENSALDEAALQKGYVPQSGQTLKDAMNGFKKFYVERALRTVDGNQTDVAAALGIQRTYLSRLLVELGIR